LPPAVKTLIPQAKLLSLAHNPQALVSAQAQQELKSALAQLGPQADQVYNQIIEALRQSLMSALTEIFIIGLGVTIVAFIIHLFIREIPLRRQHEPAEGGA
jgi:hypothetical protein